MARKIYLIIITLFVCLSRVFSQTVACLEYFRAEVTRGAGRPDVLCLDVVDDVPLEDGGLPAHVAGPAAAVLVHVRLYLRVQG